MAKNKPACVIRDGDLKATLWANQSQNGVFISATFAKTYDHNGTPKDTNSFTGVDVLRLSEIARESYRVANRLRRELNSAASDNDNTSIAETEKSAPHATQQASTTETKPTEHSL